MYCKGSHKPAACEKFKTPQERARYLRDKKLCQLCASPQHAAKDCSRQPCSRCQGPHHTSSCFKTAPNPSATSTPSTDERSQARTQGEPRSTGKGNEKKQGKTAAKVNLVMDERLGVEDGAEEQFNEVYDGAVLGIQPSRDSLTPSKTFLPLGHVAVVDPKAKKLRKVQVLIDTGAEISFIESALAEEQNLSTVEEKQLRYFTFGSDQVQVMWSRRVKLPLWDNNGKFHMLDLLTSDTFTKEFARPSLANEDVEALQLLEMQSPLEVSANRQQVRPRILLGCDQVWQFLTKDSSPVQLPSGLHLLPTALGNILVGQMKDPRKVFQLQLTDNSEEFSKWDKYWSMDANVNMVHEDSGAKEGEEELWERYWEMESAGTHEFGNSEKEEKARQEQEVWNHFNSTIEHRSDGYHVRLPWKSDHPPLPDNRAIALRRLHSVWHSLQKDKNLLQRHDVVFQEQIEKNILEDIPRRRSIPSGKIHYLPHQAVLTPDKLTTKLRIVFDASAHYKGCPSLNEVLHKGAVILPQLFGILLRFRIGKIGIIADVEKAFLQVRLHEIDRDATRCLWLKDAGRPPESDNIREMRFTRVAFGLIASPFLLAATTHFHLNTYSNERKLVQEIKDNLYVDNVLLTADSHQEAFHKYVTCKRMFDDLSMNLREFVCNDESLRQEMDEKDQSADRHPKVLGLRWNSQEDQFHIKCLVKTPQVSKRTVAQAVASIYDPLGWLIPLTHAAKLFLQSLWKDNYDWDSDLSDTHAQKWTDIVNEISGFEKIIPRVVATRSSSPFIVTFADASSESMAAGIYLCNPPENNLLMARERLPSLRTTMTIPKMELNAVTLAMRLTEAVIKEIRFSLRIRSIYIFSDSGIVLNWVRNNSTTGKSVMVANRLKEIRKIVAHLQSLKLEVYFGHVDSAQNPADCATRGLTKDQFAFHRWWQGPVFLEDVNRNWKNKGIIFQLEVEEENHPRNVFFTAEKCQDVENETCLLKSRQAVTWTQAKRIIAYVLRFIRKIRGHGGSVQPIQIERLSKGAVGADISFPAELTGEEVKEAGKVLIRHHQRTEITPAIIQKLGQLRVRKDNEGILRCYGRLGASALDLSAKYPILILQKSLLAEFIISDYHQEMHPGINHTMALGRQTFWIPQLRAQVAKQVRACVKCQRINNLPYKYPNQTDLPQERVQRSRPFEHIGLDYFGPLQVRLNSGEIGKCYGCIITCMVTRLLHLDIVPDSSTVSFLLMLRRFFGRRGVPTSIVSDNAPTFLLEEEILREREEVACSDPSVARVMSTKEIKWRHITPNAPWQGGFYERLVKSVKTTLYKTLGRSTPSLDELSTVVIEVEAFLNTRPLLYTDSTMDVDSILKPIDFLQSHVKMYFPWESQGDEADDPSHFPSNDIPSLRTKQQTIQALESSIKLTERSWKIWQTQYLTSLREHHQVSVKTKRGGVSVPYEGNLVLIQDETQPRHSWKMGRIEEICPNSEGIVREVKVRLPSRRCIRRPVNLLIPLELEGTLEEKDNRKKEENVMGSSSSDVSLSMSRYNLRPRRPPIPALTMVSTITKLLFYAAYSLWL